jgi:hypothetical protein
MRRLLCLIPLLAEPLLAQDAESRRADLEADLKFFTDASGRALRSGVTTNDLASFRGELLRTVAAQMLNGTFEPQYRVADHEAYPSPRELGRTLKLGDGFSQYENITGIYLTAGEQVVLVGPTGGKEIALLIPDWMRKPAADAG